MYTLEGCMKLVERYTKSGYSEGAVIRTLGFPSNTVLRNCHKQHLVVGKLHAGGAPKSCYTQEQKPGAV